jgi:deoxyribodipyrimidine photo-lyase
MHASKLKRGIFWHRRDLRIEDNSGLYQALKSNFKITPVFIFDTEILKLLNTNDQRIIFIHQKVQQLKLEYQKLGSDLEIFHGNPVDLIPNLLSKFQAEILFTNRDYEPYAISRDKQIAEILQLYSIPFKGFKDHVIFDKSEILKQDGKPYTVFTPYMKKWKEKLNSYYIKAYPTYKYIFNLEKKSPNQTIISLKSLGFSDKQYVAFPKVVIQENIIQHYHKTRDFPSLEGTSRLSLHLRFGTISIRKVVETAIQTNEKYLNELIWRDFYQMILYHFPYSSTNSFKKQYDNILWLNDEGNFKKWCEGKTGYPMVDAGMRELNQTGFMHNRVRMIVASFLTKHLLIDWRWGAHYFADKLLDFELASNIGGWQWAASSGCDAVPYFRIFNPSSQQEKFDSDLSYVKKWIPEFETEDYPKPIVEHKIARERAISLYKSSLNKQ